MTTVDDLKQWFKEGKQEKAAYMIIVCDTFSYEDFPIYCKSKLTLEKEMAHRTGSPMSRIMEVYDLKKPFDKQPMSGKFAWAV